MYTCKNINGFAPVKNEVYRKNLAKCFCPHNIEQKTLHEMQTKKKQHYVSICKIQRNVPKFHFPDIVIFQFKNTECLLYKGSPFCKALKQKVLKLHTFIQNHLLFSSIELHKAFGEGYLGQILWWSLD